MEYRSAEVYVRDMLAGILQETEEGYAFQYDSAYLERPDSTGVSLTLPMRKEAYQSRTLFPFFDGLIPEGWLLNVVTHNWKLDRNNRFGILLVTCHDPIGNVRIQEVRE